MSRLIDLDDALKQVAMIAKALAKSDKQKALCGRIIYMLEQRPPVKAIPLDKVEQIKQEVKEWYWSHDVQKLADDPCVVDAMTSMFIRMIDKAISEVSE